MRDQLDRMAAMQQRKKRRGPGPPTWPKNPRQDSFGNPTTKTPGQEGTEIGFGKNPVWRDMAGARSSHSSKDWRRKR